ncbi:cyclin dependent kinase inhibitor 1Ca [Centroberyx affinis]|uniref:cyclin dependent kinase inhibitor 1Ca n=1 Tax=Centroberyx affinis TaxID=166261 RepID=UPI003A5C3BE9
MSPIRRRDAVCRSLFGPVDHDQLSRDLKQKLREISEQDSRRWNFNFHTDTPLPGRYQWEETPACRSAAFYQDSTLAEDVVVGSNTEDSDSLSDCCRLHSSEETPACLAEINQENCSSVSNTLKFPGEVTPVRRKRTLSKQAAKPKNNAQITDFFVKRRRTSEAKILNPLLTSSSEAAPCKTIR